MKNIVARSFSADGLILVTADKMNTIRLYDAVTGKPLGPAYPFGKPVRSLRLTSDASALVIFSPAGTFLWKLDSRPLAVPARVVRPWVRVLTGLDMDANHVISNLDPDNWNKNRKLTEAEQR